MTKIPWVVLEAIREAGGLPLLVGGAVREAVIASVPSTTGCFPKALKISTSDLEKCKDLDFEVYNLSMQELQGVLEEFGTVDLVGKSFGVLKLHDIPNIDFSIPRQDNKSGVGHKGFEIQLDPKMSLEEASKRRDLTCNSMSLDVFTNILNDPFNGIEDIKEGKLRATDPNTFLDDPLRAMRVAQFISRLDFAPDEQLIELCKKADLSTLPGERLFTEFEKLLRGKKPSKGLEFLKQTNLIRFFPELQALIGCPQEPEWHPEGDVWNHSLMAADVAQSLSSDNVVLFSSLLHDLGKALVTKVEEGRTRSKDHEQAGIEPTRNFLTRLRAPNDLIEACCALVGNHLAPAHFCGKRDHAGPSGYRRLARKLDAAGTNIETLHLVATADHFGRTTPDAIARLFPAGDLFLQRASELKVNKEPEEDAVKGRHLIAKGLTPGASFGATLSKCRELQYQENLKDPEVILKRVLYEA